MLDQAARLLTAPSVEPVTLSEAKRHANVVASDDDTLITALIVAARELVEQDTSRALINQTWELELDDWWTDAVEVPRPPLSSVTHVKYYDANGVLQTVASTNYHVDTRRQPGVIWWDADYTLPTLSDEANPVIVTYVAGYGSAASAVPGRAKQAILLLVGHWYRHREAVGRAEGEVALAYRSLIRSLCVGVYP
jgi:uncharacterized phiE125 gp8 family phage protein